MLDMIVDVTIVVRSFRGIQNKPGRFPFMVALEHYIFRRFLLLSCCHGVYIVA